MYEFLTNEKTMNEHAYNIGVSPSTFSRRLSLLEKETGVTILERNSRSSHLTEEGKHIVFEIESLINFIKDTDDMVYVDKERLKKLESDSKALGLVRKALDKCKS